MLGLGEYSNAFRKGLNYVLYGVDENKEVPVLDKSSLVSIGYYDGYQYGIYCQKTGQTMSIKKEQLIAQIDKHHTRALNTYMEYMEEENKYVRYKSGFVEGKLDVLEKIMNEDETFNELPELDSEDLISVGYYDGYSYFLKDFVVNGFKRDDDNKVSIEQISRLCFEQRKNMLKVDKGQTK